MPSFMTTLITSESSVHHFMASLLRNERFTVLRNFPWKGRDTQNTTVQVFDLSLEATKSLRKVNILKFYW